MIEKYRTQLAFLVMALLLIIVGVAQSWSVSIGIFNLCIVSAIMAMGVNLQWGYAGHDTCREKHQRILDFFVEKLSLEIRDLILISQIF